MNKLWFVPFLFFLAACSGLTEEELINQAMDAQKTGKYDEALDSYLSYIERFPNGKERAKALFETGALYYGHRKDLDKAVEFYKQVAEEFPEYEKSPGALFLAGFIYNNELKNLDSAKAVYERFIQQYPQHELVSSAEYELANLGKDPDEIVRLSEGIAPLNRAKNAGTDKQWKNR